ncbi:hypothetical protein LCGC14_0338600 [marine sediment metagenome]|uniref:Uncharacterized protein n=1 Tax=marine sediment metagenome TaxID=412755 RepID=A0A0F9W1T8_9ZZZZ
MRDEAEGGGVLMSGLVDAILTIQRRLDNIEDFLIGIFNSQDGSVTIGQVTKMKEFHSVVEELRKSPTLIKPGEYPMGVP